MTTLSHRAALALLAAGSWLATGAAQAGGHGDVQWSVTIGSRAPAVVLAPAPVWVPARPVVVRPPVRRAPQRWDWDGDGIPNRYDRVNNRWHPAWHDRDRDGVPNRWDRRPWQPG